MRRSPGTPKSPTSPIRRPPPAKPPVKALVLSDTHLGLDMPQRPRTNRLRRGPDFFRNLERALDIGLEERVDLVIHGGDLFHRSRVRTDWVLSAIDLVRKVTERDIPFVVVPGNHERSAIPLRLLWTDPRFLVFDDPRTRVFSFRGTRLAIAGFPFRRRSVREEFPGLVRRTDWESVPCDIRLLCMHQTVEGARVGPAGFTFRAGRDVVPARSIPSSFAAVLAGHIHRAQILRRGLDGRPLGAPVLYPGSTERTSLAERLEPKGCVLLELAPGGGKGRIERCSFRRLPTRPVEDWPYSRPAATGRYAPASRTRTTLPTEARD